MEFDVELTIKWVTDNEAITVPLAQIFTFG